MKKGSNRKYLIYSIIIALFVWYFASSQVDPMIESSINDPISLMNTAAISNTGRTFEIKEPLVARISYYVRTSKADEVLSNAVSAYVDFQDLPSESENNDLKPARVDGVDAIPLKVNLNYDKDQKGIYVYDTSPNVLHAYIDELTSKEFKLTYRSEGVLSTGYTLGDVTLANETVKISGSARDINKIAEVAVTINVNNRNAAWTDIGSLKYYDEAGSELNSLNVTSDLTGITYSASLNVTQVIKIVQNYTGTCAEGYGVKSVTLTPDTITISSPLSKFVADRTIVLPTIDVSGMSESVSRRADISNSLGSGTEIIEGNKIIDIEVAIVPSDQIDKATQDNGPKSNIIILPKATRSDIEY